MAAMLMTKDHKRLINENMYTLVETMNPDGVVIFLLARAFNNEDESHINAGETREEKVKRLLRRLLLKDDKAFQEFIDALDETGQTGHAALLQSARTQGPGMKPEDGASASAGDESLDDTNKKKLTANRKKLVELIQPEDILNALYGKEKLERREMDKIKAKETRYEKNECLLDILETKTNSAFLEFIVALNQNGQSHLATLLK